MILNKIKITLLTALGMFFVAGVTQASAETVNLQGDFTAQTFWLISMAMVAATAFFFLERDTVSVKWRTSLTLAGIVTGVAAWHYMYMRGYWVENQTSPVVLRYVDWLITVPILMVEFYIIS
jgi:bacteriorhodopsin